MRITLVGSKKCLFDGDLKKSWGFLPDLKLMMKGIRNAS